MGQIKRQISAVIAMAVGATLLPVLITTKATASGSAQVTDVRVGNHKDKTRLVLDVTKPADLRYEVSADGSAVFIDLPQIKWSADNFKGRHFKGLITDFKFSPEAAGGRLSILNGRTCAHQKTIFRRSKRQVGPSNCNRYYEEPTPNADAKSTIGGDTPNTAGVQLGLANDPSDP